MNIRKVGQNTKYSFIDAGCLGRKCFAPGMYQHRSPLSCGGSRNTGSPDTPCCLNRAYRGCPEGPVGERVGKDEEGNEIVTVGLPIIDPELRKQRHVEGWRAAK